MPAFCTGLQRVDAILVGVRRADLAVVLFAGVEVVIHLVDAAGGQPLGLLGREQAEAGADVQAVLLP